MASPSKTRLPSEDLSDDDTLLNDAANIHRDLNIDRPITDISMFSTVSDGDFSTVFTDNLERIFQYNKNSVVDILKSRDTAVLDPLRLSLAHKLQIDFPGLTNKVLHNRKVPNTSASDIYLIGYSIVNNALSLEVEKVFVEKSPNLTVVSQQDTTVENELTTLPQMAICITALKKIITKLQEDLQVMNSKYEGLRDSMAKMETDRKQATQRSNTNHEARDSAGNSSDATSTQAGNDAAIMKTDDTGSKHNPISILVSSEHESSSHSSGTELSDDEYQVQKQEKKRLKKKKKNRQGHSDPDLLAAFPQNSEGGIPTAKDNNVVRSDAKDIYLGKVHVDSTIRSVCAHLRKHNIILEPSSVKQLSHTKDSKSFRISIPEVHQQKVLAKDDSLWPKGVKVRPFYPRKENRSSSRTSELRSVKTDRGAGRHYRPNSRPSRQQQQRQARYNNFDREWPRLPQSYHQSNDKSDWYYEDHEQYDSWDNEWYSGEWYRC